MKKHLLFIVGFALFASTSCNYISDPLEKAGPVINGDACKDQPFPKYTSKPVVLLEDYTGQTCPNCPMGTDTIHKLLPDFKDQLVVIAIHAGSFAEPKKAPFTNDLRTVAGDEYQKFFKVDVYPRALINRKDYPTTYKKDPKWWRAEIKALLAKQPEADLQLMSEYNSIDGKACIYVKYKLPATLPNKYKLTLLLTQDSIIGPQLVNTKINENYVFDHMLRTNITSPWGDSVIVGTSDPVEKKFQFKIESAYKNIICIPKNCHIVGFIYDVKTYRVLQAAEVEVTK